MDNTPNLSLPYIMAAQAQKHVTHNEAIRALDALVQIAVLDKDLGSPPASPADGSRYIIAASPTGAWGGQAAKIAAWQDGAWLFYAPHEGWLAWVADEDKIYVYNSSAWSELTVGAGSGASTWGINVTADTTNRLAVKSTASLFDNVGGGHQLKINKNAAGDTAATLYQTGYSGRAEFGLAGDDDFHVKVSPDGSTWNEAIVVDRTSGGARFPNTAYLDLPAGSAPATPASGKVRLYAKSDSSLYQKDDAGTETGLAGGGGGSGTAFDVTNLFVNGSHLVSQANVNAAVTSIGSSGGVATYVTDGWAIRAKGSLRVSGQRIQSISLAAYTDALRATITTTQSSLGAGDYLTVSQPVEGVRTARLGFGAAGAAAAAIGFWVRSSVTGTFAAYLTNASRNRAYLFTFSISAANTWEFKTATFAGDTSGTWATDTSVGLHFAVVLAAGSAFHGTAGAWAGSEIMTTSSQANLAATASATFDLTGAVLIPGSDVPTSATVRLLQRHLVDELALCQRYYQKSFPQSVAPGAWTEYTAHGVQSAHGTNNFNSVFPLPALSRTATPAFAPYDRAGTSGKVSYYDGSWHDGASPFAAVATDSHYLMAGTGSGGFVTAFGWVVDDRLTP
jgi:hypothetical protein